jgi:hypothetical protein
MRRVVLTPIVKGGAYLFVTVVPKYRPLANSSVFDQMTEGMGHKAQCERLDVSNICQVAVLPAKQYYFLHSVAAEDSWQYILRWRASPRNYHH